MHKLRPDFDPAAMQMPSAHHTFHDEGQTNAHDITHDASGMPIVPGSGPLIIRPDGQRMEVSACLHLGVDSQLETEVSHSTRLSTSGACL